MTRQDSHNDNLPRRMIYRTQARVQATRDEYWHRRTNNNDTAPILSDLRAVTFQYYDILRKYHDESAIKESWESFGGDQLQKLVTESTIIEEATPGRGGSVNERTAPAIINADPQVLIEITHKLDGIAKDLGFAAETQKKRTRYHAGGDDGDYPEPHGTASPPE